MHVCFPASWLRCLLPWVMVWVLSGVGAVWGCVRVLYLWEPITPLHSPKSVSFWRHRKQADLHLNRVSAEQCFLNLNIRVKQKGLNKSDLKEQKNSVQDVFGEPKYLLI